MSRPVLQFPLNRAEPRLGRRFRRWSVSCLSSKIVPKASKDSERDSPLA